jgi:hypothetical protein
MLIKNFESFNNDKIETIKDILIDLEDDGFNIEYYYDSEFKVTHIMIKNKLTDRHDRSLPFYISSNMKDCLKRIVRFLDKSQIQGFWRYGVSKEEKFFIYDDNRDIRTDGYTMDKDWPNISALRFWV